MSRSIRHALVPLALGAALVLTACDGEEAAEFDGAAGQDEQQQVEAPEPEEEAAPDESPEETRDAEPEEETETTDSGLTLDPEDASETVSYAMRGHDGEITAGLHHLRVEGETMVLMLSFVPDYDHADGNELTFNQMHDRIDNNGNAFIAPLLSDRQNLKTYHVLTEEGRAHTYRAMGSHRPWSTDINNVSLRSGEPLFVWAHYPLPEEGTDTVSIAIDTGVPEFADVEIQR